MEYETGASQAIPGALSGAGTAMGRGESLARTAEPLLQTTEAQLASLIERLQIAGKQLCGLANETLGNEPPPPGAIAQQEKRNEPQGVTGRIVEGMYVAHQGMDFIEHTITRLQRLV